MTMITSMLIIMNNYDDRSHYGNNDEKKYLELFDRLLETLPTEEGAPASELTMSNAAKSA